MYTLKDNKYIILTVFSVLFVTTWINYINVPNDFVSACLCVTVGFVIGFYFQYGTKILPVVLVSIFIANLIARITLVDETFLISFLISLLLPLNFIFIAVVFKKIMIEFKALSMLNANSIIVYLIGALIISFVGGTIYSTVMFYIFDSVPFVDLLVKWVGGYFFGIMIFGTALLFAYFYDEKIEYDFKKTILSFLFIAPFIIVASVMFSNGNSLFGYQEYSYILIVFYVAVSFTFSFRMIIIIDLLFVFIFRIFLTTFASSADLNHVVMSINIYLLVLSTISLIIKMFIYELKNRNADLSESTIKLNKLAESTESLLKLSDDLLDSPINIKEDYLKRIFHVASNIFDNFDYASCYIKEDPYVTFIASFGYDVDVLNSFNFEADSFKFIEIDTPFHVKNANSTVKNSLPKRYNEFKNIYPELKESIRFGIYIDESTVGGFSFDIIKGSDKEFNEVHLESYKSLQKLMNSFFSINYLNYKNISLKNDIVLSLIRTLELFDQYTGGHSEEVAYLASEIAKKLDISEQETHDIYWAGVVHDIGKVGVSSDIINKPEKLSLEEYEIIKNHAMFGYEILNKADDLKTIAILVKHHHEWWNGSGYPGGLKGDNIPLGSQIISICDAVSTMAKKRPYTIVKTSKQIIEELEMYKGTQFSPKPAEAMIEFIRNGLLDNFYKGR